VPFTFFAHQAPLMGLASRRSTRIDGLALVIGSMAPDLAGVSTGWGYGPVGFELFLDGHRLLNQPFLAVYATLLTVVVRFLMLPVAPLALPRRLANLRDALLWSATSRPPIWASYLCALFGALTHLLLDAFTHDDGFVVERVELLRRTWFTIEHRELATYTLLQVGLSALLGLWGVVALWKWAERPRPDRQGVWLTPLGKWSVWGCAAAGAVIGVPMALDRYGFREWYGRQIKLGITVVAMTWCWMAFAGLLLGCLLAWGQRRSSEPRSVPQASSIRS
jgi:hypothetical protein